MRLALTGRNLTVTPALQQVVTTRLEKLDRLLHGNIIAAQVALQTQKDRVKAAVRVTTRGDHDFNGHGEASTARSAVADAIAKVEHQASKVKGKWEARKRRSVAIRPVEPAEPAPVAAASKPRRQAVAAGDDAAAAPRVIRVRRLGAKPMHLEDAVLQVASAPGSLLVFREPTVDRVQVLVRRADGHIALVDPEA